MRCAVCSTEGARELRTAGGESLGHAHDGECLALLWESHFLRVNDGAEWEHAEVLWRWQRKAAQVAGRLFAEPRPTSPAEDEIDAALAVRGLTFVARELE